MVQAVWVAEVAGNHWEKVGKAMARRCTPQSEGIGYVDAKGIGKGGLSLPTDGSQSDATQSKGEVCWYCKSEGKIKTAHTYSKGCIKYIQGATKQEMEHAARGGKTRPEKITGKIGTTR